MTGDDKKRFCSQCQLHVHNLSAMSLAEQETLLSEKVSRRCVAYATDANTIQVRTGTWLLIQRLLRPWRAALTLWVILLQASGCVAPASPTPPSDKSAAQEVRKSTFDNQNREHSSGKMIAGGIPCDEPPLWRRILFFWKQ